MISLGSHVVIRKVGGEHIRVCKISRKQKILIEKLRFEIDGAIGQPYGLFEISAGKAKRVQHDYEANTKFNTDVLNAACQSKLPANGDEATEPKTTGDEPSQNAAQVRQRVTHDEIVKLKGSGISAEQLVAKLVDGSVSFSERSHHSQTKYINRKAKKHSDRVLIMQPTVRLVAESYYKKSPERVAHLRIDTLSLMLHGIHSGLNCLVFEQCLGILTAGVINRLGGIGACVHLHRGHTAQSIPCVDSMNFDSKVFATFMPLRISTLINRKIDDLVIGQDLLDSTGIDVAVKSSDSAINVMEADADIEVDDSADATVDVKSADVVMDDSTCETAGGQTEPPKERRGGVQKTEENMKEQIKRKLERLRLEKYAWELMEKQQLDALLIVTKLINPIDVLEKTWQSLRPSASVVIYSPIAGVISEVYLWLKAHNAVQVQVIDTFYRDHQVLPDRTHPLMLQNITTGFVVSAIKVAS